MNKKTVLISAKLIERGLSEGINGFKAVKGIPDDAKLVDARFNATRGQLELDFLSDWWGDDKQEIFEPIFERA